MRRIELLAPAKDAEHGKVAIDYGADAIYIGGSRFGARYAASNSLSDIEQLVRYGAQYDVKIYATLNTVLFDDELSDAKKIAQDLISTGVSALIVQDMSFMRMGLTGVELHASTQTANHNLDRIKFLSDLGFSRVILERGLTLNQIKSISSQVDCDIECFVHGAICVGNSGECYLSRSQGLRSGNRGACGQPCRLPYDLIDDQGNTLIANKHLLSVKDMNMSSKLRDLLDAGVTSLKIEGRLKDAHYIKNVVGHYRKELDKIFKYTNYCRSSEGDSIIDFTPNPHKAFSRSRSTYFIDGKRGGMATFDTPKAVGERLGKVKQVQNKYFTIDGNSNDVLSPGDGVCIIGECYSGGTNINQYLAGKIYPNKMDNIKVGYDVYRNLDLKFTQVVERSKTKRTIMANASLSINDDNITLSIADIYGNVASDTIDTSTFDRATNQEKMEQTLRLQVAKSGDTIFKIDSVGLEVAGDLPFVPMTVINNLRRSVLTKLLEHRVSRKLELKESVEQLGVAYPTTVLPPEGNVTNGLSKSLYRDHGVEEFMPQLEVQDSLRGEVVMTTPYCIRREIGECLKGKHNIKGDLFLKGKDEVLALKFDCDQCEMKVIKN